MSVPVVIEEVRLRAGNALFTGRWDLPARQTPPHPLAVILPDRPGRDLDGAQAQRPRLRPFLEISLALLARNIATFRFVPAAKEAFDASLDTAWSHATRHHLVSRQRIGLVVLGRAGWAAASRRLSAMRAAADPLGVVLVAPGDDADLAPLDGIPTSVLTYDDLTEHLQRESDWIAGRAVTHQQLCVQVADHLEDLLRPRWERATRPPGTAIGT